MPDRIPYVRPPAIPTVEPHAIRRHEEKVERDAFYGSARWRKLRASFLRANPFCARCLAAGRHVPAGIVHHVVERLDSPDLRLDWDNLEPLCSPCHTTTHNRRRNPAQGG